MAADGDDRVRDLATQLAELLVAQGIGTHAQHYLQTFIQAVQAGVPSRLEIELVKAKDFLEISYVGRRTRSFTS